MKLFGRKNAAPQKEFDPESVTLWNLVPPILLETVLRTTVGFVNVAMLSRVPGDYGTDMVNAVSIANIFTTMAQFAITPIATGSVVCMNQAIGMRNKHNINRLGTMGVAINLVLGFVFMALFLLFAPMFMSIMSLNDRAIDMATTYLRIVGSSMVFLSVQVVLSSILRSMGRPKAPLFITTVMNIVNLLGCWFVIFKPIDHNIPTIEGIAFSNFISQVVALVIAYVMIRRVHIELKPSLLKPYPWEETKMAFKIGFPGTLTSVAYHVSQIITTSFITGLGEQFVTAKTYATSLISYVALLGQASGSASQILISYKVGAGQYEEASRLRNKVTIMAVCSNAAFSILLILLRNPLIRFFTVDPIIIDIATGIIMVDIFVELGRALNNSISGSLLAVGDVTFVMWVNQFSIWVMSVGMAYVLGLVFNLGIYGIWLAFALDESTRGLILLMRWRSNKWLASAEKGRKIIKGKD